MVIMRRVAFSMMREQGDRSMAMRDWNSLASTCSSASNLGRGKHAPAHPHEHAPTRTTKRMSKEPLPLPQSHSHFRKSTHARGTLH